MIISRYFKLCFLFCALTLSLGAKAQGSFVYRGFLGTTFSGRIVDSLTKEPLPSAVISVVSKGRFGERSVRNYISDKKGGFQFKCPVIGQHRMEVAVLGYKPHVVHLTMDEEVQNLGLIRLSQSSQEIDEVVVKARVQMYKMKGDTIIYLPGAVNTMKDDAALEILRQMPGVEVGDNGSVKIMGQTVERTYVNQKLLFGEDPKTALQQLEASEVASVQAYDEVDDTDAVGKGENARKRKVLNVVTFKDFSESYTAKARGEMGTDFYENMDGKRPVRYLGSGEVGFYSEALQLSADGQSNNLENVSKTMRKSDAHISASARPNKEHSYGVEYGYTGSSSERVNASASDYFPTDYFTSQRTADSTRSKEGSDRHAFSGRYGYSGERVLFSSSLQAGFSTGNTLDQTLKSIVRDGKSLSANEMMREMRDKSRSLSGSASGIWQLQNNSSLNTRVQFDLNSDQSRGVRRERRFADGVETPLEWSTYAPKPRESASFAVDYGRSFNNAGRLSLGSEISYLGYTMANFFTDLQTGELDWPRSEDAFDRNIEWSIKPSYFLSKGDFTLSANLDYKLENRVYEDAKVDVTDRRNFHFLNGSLSYSYRKPKKSFSITFWMNSMQVSVSDFSSRIKDENPLYVSTGNRSLVPSKNYLLRFGSDFMGENSSYGFAGSISAVTNPILRRSVFFKEETVLAEYNDYRMPAGSTLTTPENGAAFLNLDISANYKVRIVPLKLFLETSVFYSFRNPEVELYGKKTRSGEHVGGVRIDLTTNFSSQFRVKVNNHATVNYQDRFGNSSHEFVNLLRGTMEWDIVSNLYLNADYTGIFRRSSGAMNLPDSHELNLSLGWRVLKQRGRIAFNAYDVLDDYVPVSIVQGVEFISRTVTYVGANYFTVSFEYKFNNRRATK